jgi:putative endonuclease
MTPRGVFPRGVATMSHVRKGSGTLLRPVVMPSIRRSPWLVYLLRCADGSLYTGITNDLTKRLKAHAAGKASRYTRSRLPVTLASVEPQRSKSAALKREVFIKGLRRAEKERLVATNVARRR